MQQQQQVQEQASLEIPSTPLATQGRQFFTENNLLPTTNAANDLNEPVRGRVQNAGFGKQLRTVSTDAAKILAHKVADMSSHPRDHWRAFVGEFIGTAMFIYLGLALSAQKGVGNILVSALTAGGALTALIFSLGHVSGGHLNPAVTLTIVLVRALPVGVGALYIVSQLLGSLAAAGLFALTSLGNGQEVDYSSFGLIPSIGVGQGLLVQVLVSAFLCWVVLATGVDSRSGEPRNFLAALPIGIAVAVGVVVAGPLVGASMNPAGSFGVIVVYSLWRYAWMYLCGPLAAAILVAMLFKFVFMTRSDGLSAMTVVRGTKRDGCSQARPTSDPVPFV